MLFILSGGVKGNSRGPGWLRVSYWTRDGNVQEFGEDDGSSFAKLFVPGWVHLDKQRQISN